MSRSFSPVEKSAHIRILPFGFFTVTMGAAQADLSIGVSTPMSTYRSNSFPTASCIANANGKGFRNTGTTPSFSSTCAFTFVQCPRPSSNTSGNSVHTSFCVRDSTAFTSFLFVRRERRVSIAPNALIQS
ncbi:conserved hypothetical protein [Trichinella spiralis]|uniref:Uncharacterized protein n=1 Tax=Trichinella spiralis TaxID=6334 RepID=E5SZB8_TRISP|nr:conserved hypothetical protein [Trichinella spiralis]KRY33272.1 hypothetical protein T01_742 [Trichinella spiralis]